MNKRVTDRSGLRQVEQLASAARRDDDLAVGLVVWFAVGTDHRKAGPPSACCPTAWRRICPERYGNWKRSWGDGEQSPSLMKAVARARTDYVRLPGAMRWLERRVKPAANGWRPRRCW